MGLYDYGARFYSTNLGRFMAADPLVSGAGRLTANPQSLDSFSYVLNNPLRYTDPTGLCFKDPVTGKMMECSTRQAEYWVICAAGPDQCERLAESIGIDTSKYDWSAVSRMARGGICSTEFREESYPKYLAGASGQDLEYYANPHGGHGDLLFWYNNTLWQYGFISDQGDTGNLDDFFRWLGDKGGDVLGAIKENPTCTFLLGAAYYTCRFHPQYCDAAKGAFISGCLRDASPFPERVAA